MRYFSTFSGIGGFELGLGAEHECVGFSEIDQYALNIYRQQFPNHKNYGDITTINTDTLPDFDLLVGGFPCQAFSIAGRRGGFEDTRGTLFFELARILRAKKPRLFIFENVKGLLSHDDGKTFRTVIATLDELGYDLQWQVINSKNHGVPQNRERIFIVGHLRGTPRPEVFPLGGYDDEDTRQVGIDLSFCLDANYYKGVNTGVNSGRSSIDKARRQVIVTGYISSAKWDRFHESSRRIYSKLGISPTIPTACGGGHTPKIDMSEDGVLKIRKLTPTECERLQGFPDGWTSLVSDTRRYQTLGNAVTSNVIRDLTSKLK